MNHSEGNLQNEIVESAQRKKGKESMHKNNKGKRSQERVSWRDRMLFLLSKKHQRKLRTKNEKKKFHAQPRDAASQISSLTFAPRRNDIKKATAGRRNLALETRSSKGENPCVCGR